MHIHLYIYVYVKHHLYLVKHIYTTKINQMMFVLFGRTSGKDCKTLLSEEKPRAWHKSIHTSKLHGDLPPIGKIYHPFCTKSATDFGKIHHRLWEKQTPFLWKTCSGFGENHAPFLRRTASVFGTKRLCFSEKVARFGENWRGFGLVWDKTQVSLFAR